MNTRTLLLMSCAVGVLGVAAGPAFAQQQGGTPSDANAAAAGQASPPPNGGATGATGIPGANGTATGSAVSGDTAGRANSRTVDTGQGVAEVVVTAEKRSQSLQRVPAAVTAFTSEKRDLIGINNIQDMTNFTPGLQYSSQLDRASLRGVGRLTNVQSAESAVAVYSDGIYTTSTVEAGKSPLFVDRTEILRGPQGTLYGRNSIGGAINVLSRRPTKDWYAEVRLTGANYGHSIVEAAISGPTGIEGVQFRLAANWDRQRDGWIKNLTGADEGNIIDTKYVEGQLKVHFNERFEAWAKLGLSNWSNGAGGPGARSTWYRAPYAVSLSGPGGIVLNPGYGLAPATAFGPTNVGNPNPLGAVNPNQNDPWTIASVVPYKVHLNNTFIFSSEWIYHLDNLDIKYTGGGTHYEYELFAPPDPNAAPISQYTLGGAAGPGSVVTVYPGYESDYQEKLTWQSHELNLTSTHKGPFQYLAGLYYFGESYDQPVYTYLPNQPQTRNISCATTAFTANYCAPSNGHIYDDRPHLNIRSKAAYAQIDWEFVPTLKTTLGIRYSKDDKDGFEDVRLLCYLVPACLGAGGFPNYSASPVQIGGLVPVAIDLTQLSTVVSQGAPGGVSKATTFDPATGFSHREYQISSDAVTGTAGLEWEPQRGTLAYAKYSRGYKAAGFRIGIDTVQSPNPATNQESVNAYELGFKKSLFDRKMTVNAALFYYDYQNAQVPVTIAQTAGTLAPSNSILFNVPKAFSRGFELETVANPIRNLNIIFNYSYLDTEITNGTLVDPTDPGAVAPGAAPTMTFAQCLAGTTFGPPSVPPNNQFPIGQVVSSICGLDISTASPNGVPNANGGFQRFQNLKGNQLPNAPHHKIAFNANYTWNFPMGSLTASGSYTWRDVQYGTIFTRYYNASPASGQFDTRFTWRDVKDRYTVIFYGKNLTNEVIYEGGAGGFRQTALLPSAVGGNPFTSTVVGTYSAYPLGAPRTYGVELQYRFF